MGVSRPIHLPERASRMAFRASHPARPDGGHVTEGPEAEVPAQIGAVQLVPADLGEIARHQNLAGCAADETVEHRNHGRTTLSLNLGADADVVA